MLAIFDRHLLKRQRAGSACSPNIRKKKEFVLDGNSLLYLTPTHWDREWHEPLQVFRLLAEVLETVSSRPASRKERAYYGQQLKLRKRAQKKWIGPTQLARIWLIDHLHRPE
jgi:hypothetical protein